MDMVGRIRRLHGRANKSEREIARMTGLSRNTVAKWLHGKVDGPPKYRRSAQTSKLTAFQEALKLALKADVRRPRHERRTAKAPENVEIVDHSFMKEFVMAENGVRAIHPGEILREEFLAPLNISAHALSQALHVPLNPPAA